MAILFRWGYFFIVAHLATPSAGFKALLAFIGISLFLGAIIMNSRDRDKKIIDSNEKIFTKMIKMIRNIYFYKSYTVF